MQVAIPQITTLVLLVHMAFGCCWHHAHGCPVECCDSPNARAEACGCDVHEHSDLDLADDSRHQSDGASPEHQPTPDKHQCEGDRCTFVRSERFEVEEGKVCAAILALETVSSLPTGAQRPAVATDSRCIWGFTAIPSLRAHLRFGVLLI